MADEPSIPIAQPVEALRFFREKGFAFGFAWQDVWQEEHARAFTVAKCMRLDVLVDIRAAVDKAIAEGQTLDMFRKELSPILVAKGWWGRQRMIDPATGQSKVVQLGSPRRLKTIYRVNMRTAQAAGRWERIQRSKKLFPFLRYVSVMDGREREEHRAWHDTIKSVDDPWWDTHYPPCGWNCRCQAQPLNQRMMDAKGLSVTDEPPSFPEEDYLNSRTGEVTKVEEGIDPGWSYNVGKAYLQGTADAATRSMDAAIGAGLDDAARTTLKEIVDSPAFDRFLRMPTGAFPVAILSEAERLMIGAGRRVVTLPGGVYEKQKRNHPDVTAEDYRRLPDIVSGAAVIVRQGAIRLIFHAERDTEGSAKWWKAIVRQDKGEPYPVVISYQPASDKEIAREARKGEVIFDRR
ncbi:MAG TPA: phage minor head protein [Sphingobium sp.]